MIHANHLALLARWADVLAHEIKNPFQAMAVNLELVKRRVGDPEGLAERAGIVEAEMNRAHDLVDAVLRMVRPWPRRSVADVDAVFETLMPVVRARARLHDIDFTHEPGGGRAAIPPGDLALVVLNLVDNAFDAVDGEAVVTRCGDDGDCIRIEVVDRGPGLAGLPGDPFEPGVTGREGRDGLGLAVCRRLVEAAGGSVAVEPGPEGSGTAAVVTLPRAGA